MTEAAREVRARLIKAAVSEKLDQFRDVVGRAEVAGVRITVKVSREGVPRAVTVEPELRVEST